MGWPRQKNTRLRSTQSAVRPAPRPVARIWRLILLALMMLGFAIALPSCQGTVSGIESRLQNSPLNQLRLENFRTESADVPRMIRTVLGEPKTFNYLLSQESTSAEVLSLIYEGLVTIDYNTSEIVPALAESWEISKDGLTFTFTLKDGLKWSDGEPLTADDVVFTYNDLIFNEEIPTDNRDVLRIGEEGKLPVVKKLSDRRVEFKIPEPFAPFLRTTSTPIMPKHLLAETVSNKDASGKPLFISTWGTNTDPADIVANGPYVIKRFIPGERIIFEANPNYWKKGPNDEPQPYIEQVVWPVVSSQDAEFVRFRSGDADLMTVTPEQFSLIKRSEEQGNYTVYNGGPVTSRLFMTFNLNKGSINDKPVVNPVKSAWFNTLEFRQAVAYAIDRETMLTNIFKGLGELQNSQIAPQSPYFSDAADIPVYDYNLDRARELLLSAGFEYKGAQLYDAGGNLVRFTLQTNVGNKIRESAGAQIKQNLAQIGIKVDFQPIDFNKLVGNLGDSLEWDAIILGFGAGVEPNSSANLWLTNGGLHLFNQQPPDQPPLPGREVYDWEQRISTLYVKAAQELDENKRKALYGETQKLVQQNLPFIHLVGQYSMSAVRNDIENVQYTALGGVLWNLPELRITEN